MHILRRAEARSKGEKIFFSLMRSLRFPCVSDRLSLLVNLLFELCFVVSWGDGASEYSGRKKDTKGQLTGREDEILSQLIS